MENNKLEDPFTSEAPAGEQKESEDNVCIACEG